MTTYGVCCNPYSLLPTEIVIQLVGSLNNLRTTLFHKIIQPDECADQVYLYTVWRTRDNYADYIIAEIPFAGPPPYNKITGDDFRFFSINYADDGTLIQSLIMDNVVSIPTSVVRSFIVTTFRSNRYTLTFNLYQFGDPTEQKEAICNLFAFPHFTFILYGNILVNFTLIDYFPVITYIGRMNEDTLLVDSFFNYDYANGTILGLIESQLIFLWNDKSFTLANFYPDLKGIRYDLSPPELVPVNVIIGGQNVFNIEERRRDASNPDDWNIIRKATKGRIDSYVGNEPIGGKLNYNSLKEFILIESTTSPLYIIAFTTIKLQLNQFPIYAVIGESNFLDTQTKLRTFPVPCEFVDQKDNSFQQYESIYFKYTPEKVFIYTPGFESWLRLNKSTVPVNDLNMSLLNSRYIQRTSFDPVLNKDRHLQPAQAKVKNTFESRFKDTKDF